MEFRCLLRLYIGKKVSIYFNVAADDKKGLHDVSGMITEVGDDFLRLEREGLFFIVPLQNIAYLVMLIPTEGPP